MLKLLKTTMTKSFKNKLGALLLKKDVYGIKDFMDYNNYGGGVMLGVNKTIIKGHGSSKASAVYHCVKQAYTMEKNNLVNSIGEAITKLNETKTEE
jgi:glycerol-3-phosphate acyltransferase PlsX